MEIDRVGDGDGDGDETKWIDGDKMDR